MCAIFGSTDYDNFVKLYELNKPRGVSASSAIVLTGGNWMQLIKSDGAFDENRLLVVL